MGEIQGFIEKVFAPQPPRMNGNADIPSSLNQNTRQLINLVADGILYSKTLEAAKQLIEEIAMNNY